VIDNNRPEALTIVRSLSNKATNDPFVRARAITLRELILIGANRNEPPADSRKHLREAIWLDGTVALAFNGLGIVATADAKKMLETGNLEKAMNSMDEAEIEFEMAADLDASAVGTYRTVNNRIFGLLLLTKWSLERGAGQRSKVEAYLKTKDYETLDAFFARTWAELLQYEPLAPELPVALETMAQISFVRSLYIRSKGDSRLADEIIRDGHETFLNAIDGGLYRGVGTKEAAKSQFDRDFLHTPIVDNPEYKTLKDQIHQRIDDWYLKNVR
jgi:hypothetical protein